MKYSEYSISKSCFPYISHKLNRFQPFCNSTDFNSAKFHIDLSRGFGLKNVCFLLESKSSVFLCVATALTSDVAVRLLDDLNQTNWHSSLRIQWIPCALLYSCRLRIVSQLIDLRFFNFLCFILVPCRFAQVYPSIIYKD